MRGSYGIVKASLRKPRIIINSNTSHNYPYGRQAAGRSGFLRSIIIWLLAHASCFPSTFGRSAVSCLWFAG
jgi:hypothetical protein